MVFWRVYGRYLPDNHHSIANNIENITGMGEDLHAQRGNKKELEANFDAVLKVTDKKHSDGLRSGMRIVTMKKSDF